MFKKCYNFWKKSREKKSKYDRYVYGYCKGYIKMNDDYSENDKISFEFAKWKSYYFCG